MPGILIVAEHLDGALRDITGEMIGAAAALKDPLGGPLMVAVIGDEGGSLAEAANLEGVDEVISVKAPHAHFDAALYEEAVCTLAEERAPSTILIAHSAAGMAYGPAVA
ncbi:MAG: electron transfer flavoprotein subunit alpha/FixB family protein, partial [Rhodospirillaceae bacterium]|nr:electron transfer flavoprotein subunit alpha/FixB family protein [Rhodospirillaceae bacterium]